MQEVKIAGMTCAHCVASVTAALEEMGLTAVSVSLESGAATFTPTTAFSEAQITEAIEDIGFDVESVH